METFSLLFSKENVDSLGSLQHCIQLSGTRSLLTLAKSRAFILQMLACRSCTFSILHNWKETLTLADLSCFLGSVMQVVMMIHINITVQIPLPPWRKEKGKKIYLWQTLVTWLGGDLRWLWRKWCENPERMDFALLCSSAVSHLWNRKGPELVTVLEGRKSNVQVLGVVSEVFKSMNVT